MQKNKVTICGAGLVGSLLALFLARRGFQVDVYERRKDPRQRLKQLGTVGEGRSINLAISTRGLHALSLLELDQAVRKEAIPMKGRMMHAHSGELTYQQYGSTDSQYINSISRGWLNCFLLDEAEKHSSVRLFFNQKLIGMNLERKEALFETTTNGAKAPQEYEIFIGTDGSSSEARDALQEKALMAATNEELSHGYKEFVMPAKSNGDYKMEKNALHIWPRGTYMMIALPNSDGSFTCTLFMPNAPMANSKYSFMGLKRRTDVDEFFRTEFPDFLELVPDSAEQFFSNPMGKMVTIKTDPWFYKGEVLLMGDATHAIVPFFGQGMNSGFEDVVAFDELLKTHLDWKDLFQAFYALRKTNTDAIADMAVENFTEMAEKTADPQFLYQKKLEKKLNEKFPEDYVSRYSLVSFSRAPYRLAYEAGVVQSKILNQLTKDHYPSEDINFETAKKIIDTELKPIMAKVAAAIR